MYLFFVTNSTISLCPHYIFQGSNHAFSITDNKFYQFILILNTHFLLQAYDNNSIFNVHLLKQEFKLITNLVMKYNKIIKTSVIIVYTCKYYLEVWEILLD